MKTSHFIKPDKKIVKYVLNNTELLKIRGNGGPDGGRGIIGGDDIAC